MCSRHYDVLSFPAPEQQAMFKQKLFAFIYQRRKKQHVRGVIQTAFLIPPSEQLLAWRKKTASTAQ